MGKDRTRDHVPPRSFFPPSVRRHKNLSRLDVVWAHKKCNKSYELDEEYFLQSLAPLARRTEVGPALWERIDKPILTLREVKLQTQIAREFWRDPRGRVRKTWDRERVNRVVRKWVRGLWFLRFENVLPPEWRYDVAFYDPVNRPPQEMMAAIENDPSWGFYPELFFFKTSRATEYPVQAWTFFLWDWFVIFVFVHESACSCEVCTPKPALIVT
jgi:hypothetical protein